MSKARQASTFVSRQVESSRMFFLDADASANKRADVDETGDGAGDFTVVFGGFERCRIDYRIDRRSFPWYCLEFVNRGSGSLHLGNAEHELRPGSFFLYGPSLPHRIVSSPENPLGKYFVGFTGSGVRKFLERYDMVPGMVARCLKGEAIRRTYDTLIDRGVRKSPLARPLCALLTRQLLMMCRDDAGGPVNTESPAFLAYTRARECMEARFLDLSTLEAVAKASGTEPAYLCRLFSRYHDESPYQFLTRLRMDHASRLLLEGASSVRSVAAALGFKDAFHFSRVFKSVHHVPPSRFRQSLHPQWQG